MAKKRDPWDLSAAAIEKKAKASIKEIAPKAKAPNTKKNAKPVPIAPAKKVGRPRVSEEPLKVLRVFESVHKLARQMAANNDLTIIEYMNELIRREYERTK